MSVAAVASPTLAYSIVIEGETVRVADGEAEIMTAQHVGGVLYGASWRPGLQMSTTARSRLIFHVQRQMQRQT